MNEILAENKRLKAEVEKLLTENMELMGVIRSLRANAREDAERIKQLKRERDEARENLRILAGLVAYGLGQSGEEWSLEAMRQATTAIQKAKALEGEK